MGTARTPKRPAAKKPAAKKAAARKKAAAAQAETKPATPPVLTWRGEKFTLPARAPRMQILDLLYELQDAEREDGTQTLLEMVSLFVDAKDRRRVMRVIDTQPETEGDGYMLAFEFVNRAVEEYGLSLGE